MVAKCDAEVPQNIPRANCYARILSRTFGDFRKVIYRQLTQSIGKEMMLFPQSVIGPKLYFQNNKTESFHTHHFVQVSIHECYSLICKTIPLMKKNSKKSCFVTGAPNFLQCGFFRLLTFSWPSSLCPASINLALSVTS